MPLPLDVSRWMKHYVYSDSVFICLLRFCLYKRGVCYSIEVSTSLLCSGNKYWAGPDSQLSYEKSEPTVPQ